MARQLRFQAIIEFTDGRDDAIIEMGSDLQEVLESATEELEWNSKAKDVYVRCNETLLDGSERIAWKVRIEL